MRTAPRRGARRCLLCLSLLAPGVHAQPAVTDPMGATPHRGFTTFRVWGPYLQSAAVRVNAGPPVAMTPEAGAAGGAETIWTARVPGARAGETYRYVMTRNGTAGMFADPCAQQLMGYDSSAESVIVDRAPVAGKFVRPAVSSLVIYELHIGSFHAASRDHKFTFAGAAGKLDYLRSLGVDAVEIMPVALNPRNPHHAPPDYDWGYDPLQLYAVSPSYGTPADLKTFVRQCHAHGIAVILDVVYNHLTSGNLLERFAGYASPESPEGVYFSGRNPGPTPWGPRPDFSNPLVRRHIEDNALLWLREYGVDGERWDSTDNIRGYRPAGARESVPLPGGEQLLREFNAARPAGTFSIAEDLSRQPLTTQRLDAGGLGFDSRWNNALASALRQAVSAPDDEHRRLGPIADALRLRFGDSAFRRVVYTEDHDTVGHPQNGAKRLPALSDPTDPSSTRAKQLSTLASAIVLTTPGIPMLFQGQEMLDARTFSFGSAVPLDWDRPQRLAGIVRAYHDLIALRRNLARTTGGLTGGEIQVYRADETDKTLAYRRFSAGRQDDVVVVANFSGRAQPALTVGFPRAGTWHLRFNSGSALYDPAFQGGDSADAVASPGGQDGLACHGSVRLAPYSLQIFSQ